MPEPQEAETVEAVAEAPAATEAPEPKKRAPRQKKARAASKPRMAREAAKPASKTADAQPAARAKRKTYSDKERTRILSKIGKSIGRGGSIKSAVSEASISEQTYYQWKKAAGSTAPVDDLKDLVALEEENKRLKRQLAEHLRKENAEIRKKLGLK
jgi:putative transposase